MVVFFVKSNENTHPKERALMQMYRVVPIMKRGNYCSNSLPKILSLRRIYFHCTQHWLLTHKSQFQHPYNPLLHERFKLFHSFASVRDFILLFFRHLCIGLFKSIRLKAWIPTKRTGASRCNNGTWCATYKQFYISSRLPWVVGKYTHSLSWLVIKPCQQLVQPWKRWKNTQVITAMTFEWMSKFQ